MMPEPVVVWRPVPGAPGALAAQQTGSDDDPRIVFVHGFTQTGNSWKPIAESFARRGHSCIVVDLPGHGDSGTVHADLPATAGKIAAIGGAAIYVGYSLGGRACLHVALLHPHLVRQLVLVGASPGIADDGERAQRRLADERLAAHIHEVGVAAFLREWTALPLFGDLTPTPAEMADRMRNTADGLAASLRMAGTGAQQNLWPRLHELDMPVLAIAGAEDQKFAQVARQIAEAARPGTCTCRLIAGAAHAAHLQRPELVTDAIDAWLTPAAG
jgi:2-succinyl-6-hydroxy-2,4-cyclohexadiene-1-carboxylate synthase